MAATRLVHVEDISHVVLAVLRAPRQLVDNEAFNVGANSENYRIRDIAELVEQEVPGTQVVFAKGASSDTRSYRVDCSKLTRILPAALRYGMCAAASRSWTLPTGGTA